MSEFNILDVDIDNLKEMKYSAMKEHVIVTLQTIVELIKENRFDEVDNLLFYSPSGDCMGCENHCINFAWKKGQYLDISETINILSDLKRDMECENE